MVRRGLAWSLVLLALGCSDEGTEVTTPPVDERPTRRAAVDHDRDNLLNIAHGASLVSRTAESDLEQSALHAIDGIETSRWVSPTGDGNMTATFTLAAPARIERLGIVPVGLADSTPETVVFELSKDGTRWQQALKLTARAGDVPHVEAITPTEASWIRVSTIEPTEAISQLRSVVAEGSFVAQPVPPRLDGCWVVNGFPGTLVSHDNRLRGSVDFVSSMTLDGGFEGRVARLMWMRGPMWGYAAATAAVDDRTFSMLTIHEEILLGSIGAAWVGARCTNETPKSVPTPGIKTFLDVAGRWSMFGLAFDERDTLLPGPSTVTLDETGAFLARAPGRHRIVSREFRGATADENKRRASARLESLRQALVARGVDASKVEFIAAGSESPQIEKDHAVMRLLASRIDLERIP
jgi:hypothetical protein